MGENFLDCARALEQCVNDAAASDALLNQLDATMQQESLYTAESVPLPGGGVGGEVENLGFNHALGGYLVRHPSGNIYLSQSQSNSGIETGGTALDECDLLVNPPAWLLDWLGLRPFNRGAGAQYITYVHLISDADGCLIASEFWIGGLANKLLRRYEARHEPTSIAPFFYIDPDTIFVEPVDGILRNTDFADPPTLEDTWSVSESGSTLIFDVTAATGGGTAIPTFRTWDDLPLHFYEVDFTVSANISSPVAGASSYVEVLDGSGNELIRINVEGDSGSASADYSKCLEVDISIALQIGEGSIENGSGSGSVSFTGTKALYLSPELIYSANENGVYYSAIRYLRGEGDFVIEYFRDNQLIATYDAVNAPMPIDWRSSLLILNPDEDPVTTGDFCVDAYREDPLTNLFQGRLRTVISDLEVLKDRDDAIQVSEQVATSLGSCSLSEPQIVTFTTRQLQPPTLEPGQTAETLILWAAL